MNRIIESLVREHRRIDRLIRQELGRLLPDSVRIQRLKKSKLAVKDRLAGYFRRGGKRPDER